MTSPLARFNLSLLVCITLLICGFGGFCVSAVAQDSVPKTEQESIAELPTIPSGLNQGFSLVWTPATQVTATLTLEVETPSLRAETWIFAMPQPPDLPGQKLIQGSTTPGSKNIVDKSVFKRVIRRCRMEVQDESQRHSAKFRCNDKLQLFARSLTYNRNTSLNNKVQPLSPDDRQNFLHSTPEYDYPSEVFQRWKSKNRLKRDRNEGEVRFARRVFQNLATTFRYSYVPSEDRTASRLCLSEATDCGGLSTLFASVMRSEGVPARILSGRWASSARPGEKLNDHPYYQYHVIAEFHAQGVGWIPVDTSSAILHDRTESKLKYFGQSPGDFITYHIDPCVEFETDLYGSYRADYFQIPLMWVRGEGSLDDYRHQESWTVTP